MAFSTEPAIPAARPQHASDKSWPARTAADTHQAAQLEHAALGRATKPGHGDTLALMLDLGFPLGRAAVGSGDQLDDDPAADWVEAVKTLLEHDASISDITFVPDDPKPPSPEVAVLPREQIEARSA